MKKSRNDVTRRIWECMHCKAYNVWNYHDNIRAERILTREVYISKNIEKSVCTCGKCHAIIYSEHLNINSNINVPLLLEDIFND